MKLLHCLNSPKIGGIERLVINLAVEQKSIGIDVAIMLDSVDGEYYKTIIENEIDIILSGVQSGFEISLFKCQNLKQQFKIFDVIHFHHFSFIKSLAAMSSNTVYTIHGLSKGVRKENKIKYYFRETIKSFCLNKVDVFIANSQYTLNLAKKHYGLQKVKSIFILNGINVKNSENVNPLLNNKYFTVGLVTRFIYRKRIDRLIIAFKYFIEMGGVGKLILVGDGETFNDTKVLVDNEKLNKDVILTGYKTDVSEYYKGFDICVFPSENEPFGLVGVEAYLNGKPVIAFKDSGGLMEIVEPLEPENIVEDEKHLAKRLFFYFQNRNLISNHAQERKDYAKNNFSIQRMEREYFDVYKSILN
tara:strand:+ start:4396 stop:5475 length:1080 start_codon:yes stop_codon:yes gene_type:complete